MLIILAVFLVVTLCGIGVFILNLQHYAEQPAALEPDNVVIDIPAGQSFKNTAQTLFKHNLIKSPFKFNLVARLKGYDKRLKAGEYALSATLTPIQIMEKLVKGQVVLYKLTVPEGLNIYQIADLVAQAGFGENSAFIEAATNADLARKYSIPAETLEGYLFPETYYFPKSVRAETIITTMVKRFWKVFTPAWKERAIQLGFSIHQIVTLASIIEKETGAPFERPLISSVFHNRLKRKMRLESDPTVIYGLKNFDGNLKREHLETLTPYNTYKIMGLPAGPIANPGEKSLEAALYPADTKFIYFVSKKDKTHQFSTNLKDHNRAVQKYQLRR
ncbi:MAG: endolytic transglycosylase MltG [Deltaproteobacteria bacterium]